MAERPETQNAENTHPLLGVVLLALPFILFVALIEVWPSAGPPAGPEAAGLRVQITGLEIVRNHAKDAYESDTENAAKKNAYVNAEAELAKAQDELSKQSAPPGVIFGTRVHSNEVRLLLIVLLAGAIGSSIHAANAYARHRAVKDYHPSWFWWYLLRFPIGMGLALLIYLVARGGLFAGSFANNEAATDMVNPFGFAALSALAGLFAKQATAKLEEIFDNIFRTDDQHDRKANPPVVDNPPTVHVGATGEDLNVQVSGRNFAEGATVTVNGEERVSKRVSDTELIVTLLDSDVAEAGELAARVVNPPDKGGQSERFKIVVAAQE